jgi:hypothetical protein
VVSSWDGMGSPSHERECECNSIAGSVKPQLLGPGTPVLNLLHYGILHNLYLQGVLAQYLDTTRYSNTGRACKFARMAINKITIADNPTRSKQHKTSVKTTEKV